MADRFNVLLVSNDAHTAGSCHQHLTDYELSEEHTGKTALQQCNQLQPDCILIDSDLPGFEKFLGMLPADIPIVILVSRIHEDLASHALKNSAHDYVLKDSLTYHNLRRAIHNAIDKVHLKMRLKRLYNNEANLAKRSFLANISHEIRTPLGAILGFAELIRNPQLAPTERESMCSSIQRNGAQLTDIVNGLLELAKIETDNMIFVSKEFNLVELLLEIDSTARAQICSKERAVLFETSFVRAIPVMVESDRDHLRQILSNIVGNAVKFTAEGLIRVLVNCESCDPTQCELSFTIVDSGPGFTEDQKQKLFLPFSQMDESTTRRFGGTGLGLNLSRRLARLLGGDLTLVSTQIGRGSRFRLTVPAKISPGVKRVSRLTVPHMDKKTFYPNLTGMNILLVEDSMDNQFLMSRFLTMAGAKVELANNGKEGVEKALRLNFDVILMDLQMPVLDGYEATAELRKRDISIPIIAVTAHALHEDRERSLRIGCNDHMTKPIDRRSLLEKVAQYSPAHDVAHQK